MDQNNLEMGQLGVTKLDLGKRHKQSIMCKSKVMVTEMLNQKDQKEQYLFQKKYVRDTLDIKNEV